MGKYTQAEIVSEIKRVRGILKKPPSRPEFLSLSSISNRQILNTFGSWSAALSACGFGAQQPKPSQITVEDIRTKRLPLYRENRVPTLFIGDTHFPFSVAIGEIYEYLVSHKEIKRVVQCGDLYDLYAAPGSKFPRSHITLNPWEEISEGRKCADTMWGTIQKIRRFECIQLLGNHCTRVHRKVLTNAPELEPFIEFNKWYEFPDVRTVLDPREIVQMDDYGVMHGHYARLGQHRDAYMQNIVCAHSHRPGILYKNYGSPDQPRVLFEFNVGYLGDASSLPLSYTPTKLSDRTNSFGVMDGDGPRVILI